MAPHATSSRAPAGLSRDQIVLLRAKLLCELAEQLQQADEARATAIALTGQSDSDSMLEREVADAAASRAASAASEVEHALARLEVGTYGSCEGCSFPIPFERLEVIPHARRCTACSSSGVRRGRSNIDA